MSAPITSVNGCSQDLLHKLSEGVTVYFIYDDIGSAFLPQGYLNTLTDAGAQVRSFGCGNSRRRRLQLNFRNHRKLLICDGKCRFCRRHQPG